MKIFSVDIDQPFDQLMQMEQTKEVEKSKINEPKLARVWKDIGLRHSGTIDVLVERSTEMGMDATALQNRLMDWLRMNVDWPRAFTHHLAQADMHDQSAMHYGVMCYVLSRCALEEKDCLAMLEAQMVRKEVHQRITHLMPLPCPRDDTCDMPPQKL